MMKDQGSIGILGAGISGLSAAYALHKRGFDISVYEKSDQAGGVIQTYHKNGWMVEHGPNTMLIRNQQLWDLLDELNLSSNICESGLQAKKRYIVRNGKTCPLPMGLIDFLKSDLLSTTAKFRLLKEPFVSAPSKMDESIASFIRRRLGNEAFAYTVNPFVAGVYGGDPSELSIKHTFASLFEMEQRHGSVAKGFIKRDKKSKTAQKALISFNNGLQQLPKVMREALGDSVQLNSPVKKVSETSDGWKVTIEKQNQTIEQQHNALISALPAHQLGHIWRDKKCSDSISTLTKINYAPMSVLGLGFKRDQIEHPLDGFGMLIPEKEPFSFLGCLFSSSLFEARAPKNHVLLTCFIGGARYPEKASESIGSLVDEIMPQLRELLGAQGAPVFQHHTFWEKAIPQYTVGYDSYLQAIERIEDRNPGLYLTGSFRGGVSVPDCILNGFEMAKRVSQRSDHSG